MPWPVTASTGVNGLRAKCKLDFDHIAITDKVTPTKDLIVYKGNHPRHATICFMQQ